MDVKLYRSLISSNLENHLNAIAPDHKIKSAYYEAVFPTGKLFRPLLVAAVALDTRGAFTETHQYFSSFIELHHCYTLVHDDLPCMDNDQWRRGKASAWVRNGEWQAVLLGDGLLTGSFELLANTENSRLFKLATKLLGSRGLIHGQVLDLGNENESFEDILRVHELKTSRLIQTALVGSAMLSNVDLESEQVLMKLGEDLGITFQLFDDLDELLNTDISIHEKEINAFHRFKSKAQVELKSRVESIQKSLESEALENTNVIIDNYLRPRMTLLDRVSKL